MKTEHLPAPEYILDSLINSVLIIDYDLVIHYANHAALEILAQSQRKIYGTPLPVLFSYCSLDEELMLNSLKAGHSFTDNEVTLVFNNHSHVMSLSAQPFSTPFILLELSQLDSQRKFSQEQAQNAQQLAARELIRGLAHEIKNPLGGLRGAAQLLAKALPDPQLNEYTQVIIEQADRLRVLVDRLLGPQYPGPKTLQSIHHSVENIVRLVSLEKPSNIILNRDYDPSLPDLEYYPDQIEQVLLNIIRNALQALSDTGGSITLRTRTAFQVMLQGERYRLAARIDIEDNGPGIPLAIQDTLFYPMVSGRSGGTGLGLSIVHSLVDQHAGKIEFTSWPGHTEFSIYLPIKK